MPLRDVPIRRKVIRVVLTTNAAVLLLTCAAFFAYEFFTYRQSAVRQLSTLGQIIATNSTAALAFENQDDAKDVLHALSAEPHIVLASIYDTTHHRFAQYAASGSGETVPSDPGADGDRFVHGHLVSVQPVMQGTRRLGTVYLESDMGAMYARFRLYGVIVALIILSASLLAYVMSRRLQRHISTPILALAETAKAISERGDYSVRATKVGSDEVASLTDAFNQMVTRIEEQNEERRVAGVRLQAQLSRLDLLNRITHAIGDRQDLASIFEVILRNLEDNLPVDFGCICLYNPFAATLTVSSVGTQSRPIAQALHMVEDNQIPIDQNGLSSCVEGHLVYEPDVSEVKFPFPERLTSGGLRALVAAPLQVQGKVMGVLIAARRPANSFTSADCEFLRQLSEHVALASHQAKLYTALQQAYDDLRESQRTVLQQERLKALGAMASGIAHDINNAITPAALYTESLLEQDKTLSDRAREQLTTIQRAIEDVAQTVTRMREFYRQREPQLVLTPIDLNRMVQHVIDLTRARWRDLPQKRGVVIQLQAELDPSLPKVMGAEGEIRDALTNLIFNAVDAMTEGGTLTLRTRAASARRGAKNEDLIPVVHVEVSDTGIGMSDEIKRRSLEPFFTTKGERGTGLGLAMVYGMTQRHSADIDIESVLGKGTTVRLIFPVPTTIVATPATDSVTTPTLPSLRILIVDDDPVLLKSLRDILEQDTHAVTPAEGGQAGITAFQSAFHRGTPFDAVITDLGMPYVDGRTVAASIKEISSQTPIILLTGWGQRLLAEHDVPPNVDRLLPKPPKLNDIRTALVELTQTRHTSASTR